MNLVYRQRRIDIDAISVYAILLSGKTALFLIGLMLIPSAINTASYSMYLFAIHVAIHTGGNEKARVIWDCFICLSPSLFSSCSGNDRIHFVSIGFFDCLSEDETRPDQAQDRH